MLLRLLLVYVGVGVVGVAIAACVAVAITATSVAGISVGRVAAAGDLLRVVTCGQVGESGLAEG